LTGRPGDAAVPEDGGATDVFCAAATGTGAGVRAATGTALWHAPRKTQPN